MSAHEITDAMVEAYLAANDAYWREVDALPRDITKPWRRGTPKEATRVSLQAALAAVPTPVAGLGITAGLLDVANTMADALTANTMAASARMEEGAAESRPPYCGSGHCSCIECPFEVGRSAQADPNARLDQFADADKMVVAAQSEAPIEVDMASPEYRAGWSAGVDLMTGVMVRAALATQRAARRTRLEQYDLDQSPEYRKGWEDGRLKGFEVGQRYAREWAQRAPIYQLQTADGSWIDQARHSYEYNLKNGVKGLRILYASTPPGPKQAVAPGDAGAVSIRRDVLERLIKEADVADSSRLHDTGAIEAARNALAAEPTEMDAALAAGDGALHGAISHWQERALRAEQALQFYASPSDYKAPFTGGMGKLWSDCGETARAALAQREGS